LRETYLLSVRLQLQLQILNKHNRRSMAQIKNYQKAGKVNINVPHVWQSPDDSRLGCRVTGHALGDLVQGVGKHVPQLGRLVVDNTDVGPPGQRALWQ